MSLKKRIIISGVVLGLMMLAGAVGIWHIMENVPSSQREARAGMLGSGVATLGCIVLGFVWLPYAYQIGARKRAEREKAAKKKSRR